MRQCLGHAPASRLDLKLPSPPSQLVCLQRLPMQLRASLTVICCPVCSIRIQPSYSQGLLGYWQCQEFCALSCSAFPSCCLKGFPPLRSSQSYPSSLCGCSGFKIVHWLQSGPHPCAVATFEVYIFASTQLGASPSEPPFDSPRLPRLIARALTSVMKLTVRFQGTLCAATPA